MKWGLLFLIVFISLFSLNSLALLIGGGGPNNSGAGVYTQTITVNGGLASTTLNGKTLYKALWANPSYLSNTSTGGLIITPDSSYTSNNVSFLHSGNAGFALNVTFTTPSTTAPGGAFAIGFGIANANLTHLLSQHVTNTTVTHTTTTTTSPSFTIPSNSSKGVS
ncbi:SSV1 B277-like (core gene) [Saccharolobus shibatae]|uniref:SSV1 B277-like (Core gene) n=1 Tax=Saccharolobus shibatae TaxID=2286 RepID=A0A8F5C3C3_9CREN|nr:B277 family protein [Saccharolobus shibatae]QXJ33201.1 hypothetical protein J5U21_02870 [Saccharolobus shibatae]QXJ36318.1 SSV1 B277-like (core gene) [Saccharolobus shibatae]